MEPMDSPRPFYYEEIGGYYHLFLDGVAHVFRSYDELNYFVSEIVVCYELIPVDITNWQELADQGCFE